MVIEAHLSCEIYRYIHIIYVQRERERDPHLNTRDEFDKQEGERRRAEGEKRKRGSLDWFITLNPEADLEIE